MREFKVGDRLRLKEDYMTYPAGHVLEVVKYDRAGDPVTLCPNGMDDPWYQKDLHDIAELITDESDPINHPEHYQSESGITGGRVNYYLARIDHPQREDQPAYTAECEDIIEALRMTPDEANIFKEIWRSSNARLGNGKPDHRALYGAEKINHYAGRNLRRHQREAQK